MAAQLRHVAGVRLENEMSENPILLSDAFGDIDLTFLRVHGRPALLASQVSAAIGYASTKTLSTKIRGDWSDEFIEGADFMVLDGDAMDLLRFAVPDSLTAKARAALVLFESGWNLALVKTNKPAGKVLRRHLAEEVMPQIVRDGSYLPEREVTKQGEMVDSKDERLRAREERLSRQLEERQIRRQAKARREAAKIGRRLGADERVCAVIELEAAALEAGRDFAGLLPAAEPDWLSPTEIGDLLGVTANKVGRTISSLGLREVVDGLARSVMNTGNGGKRTVITWQYSPRAVEQIRAALSASA